MEGVLLTPSSVRVCRSRWVPAPNAPLPENRLPRSIKMLNQILDQIAHMRQLPLLVLFTDDAAKLLVVCCPRPIDMSVQWYEWRCFYYRRHRFVRLNRCFSRRVAVRRRGGGGILVFLWTGILLPKLSQTLRGHRVSFSQSQRPRLYLLRECIEQPRMWHVQKCITVRNPREVVQGEFPHFLSYDGGCVEEEDAVGDAWFFILFECVLCGTNSVWHSVSSSIACLDLPTNANAQ